MTGRALRAWRERNGYTMADLARALMIDIGKIDRWEKSLEKVPTFLQIRLNALEQMREEEGGGGSMGHQG